ncbi:hypothetical protein [Erwinia endophytica]|uniref:tail fiber/spike domain-containing protein n=1 Tax=Erwinia endophytica TaxID=1563158 RepID=UPI00186B6524|nr:hypothetical protein [Erwinia endophytica]
MATTPTSNAVPSESPRDLKFNAGKIDEFVTSTEQQYIDRFGNAHYTIEGLRYTAQQAIASFGWIVVKSFQDGATLTLPNEVLYDEGSGEYYRWDGELPKVVPAGSTPETSGGIGTGAWISTGDATLRSSIGYNFLGKVSSWNALSELTPTEAGVKVILDSYYEGGNKGGGIFVSVAGAGTDNGGTICVPNASTTFYWQRVDANNITPYMFGAYGDGTTEDGVYFSKALAAHSKLFVPRGDIFYINTTVTNGETQNRYKLGGFEIDSDGAELHLGESGSVAILASGSYISGLKLIPVASGVTTAISVGDLSGEPVEHWGIINCFIGSYENSATNYFSTAISLKNAWYGTISGNDIMNVPAYVGQFGTGIIATSSVNISITRNTIMSFSVGVEWSSDNTVGNHCEGWMISNNTIIACTQAAIFPAGLFVTLDGNIIDIILGTGVAISSDVDALVIANNWISVAGNAITSSGDNATITGNQIYGNLQNTGTSTSYAINITGGIEGMISNNNARGFDGFLDGNSTEISYWTITENTIRDMTTAFSDLSYFTYSTYLDNIHRGTVTDSSFSTPATSYVERGKFRISNTVSAVSSSSGSYSVTIPAGVFAETPMWGRAMPINVSADYILSYSPSESTATSAKFYVRNVTGSNIAAFACQFEFSGE